MDKGISLNIGDEFRVPYPFVKEKIGQFAGAPLLESWRPGVRFEMIGPEDEGAFADDEGKMILVIVDIHKPGHYPERVFFTRKWEDPNRKQFGKNNLRIITTSAFRKMLNGYRYEYEVENEQS